MPRRTKKPPAYRHFKPRNLAVVRIDGRDHYLGRYGSPESHETYLRLLAERSIAPPRTPPPPAEPPVASLTIDGLINRYRKFAAVHYQQDGKPGKEYVEMKYAARPLRRLFGNKLASEFGPLKLKAVQRHLVEQGTLCRSVINKRVNRIKRIFKWGVSEELVPPSVHQGLLTVPPLMRFRTTAREKPPIAAVPWSAVAPVLEEVSKPVAAMIRLQWLTGMRPCEVVAMRPVDIDRSSDVWIYRPHKHKNMWRGLDRTIPLGPKAQAILKPFLLRSPALPCFSPLEAEAERNAERRTSRRTPMTPSQRARKPKAKPSRAKRDAYDRDSYRRAIEYGVEKANRKRKDSEKLPKWTPLQIRHGRATEVRNQYGLEAAQVVLGHAHASITEVYAERNLTRAIEIAKQSG